MSSFGEPEVHLIPKPNVHSIYIFSFTNNDAFVTRTSVTYNTVYCLAVCDFTNGLKRLDLLVSMCSVDYSDECFLKRNILGVILQKSYASSFRVFIHRLQQQIGVFAVVSSALHLIYVMCVRRTRRKRASLVHGC